MQQISLTVPLSGGSVTLRAWGAHVTDALLLDLITVTATLGELRAGGWEEARPADVQRPVWGAFFRLVTHSLDGMVLPHTTFTERMTLLEAMWVLNDLEAAEGKLAALTLRATRQMERLSARLSQGQPTPSISSSSAGSVLWPTTR